jgi:hypothetical protein
VAYRYEPSKLIKKLKIREKAGKLENKSGSINKAAFKSLTEFGVLPKKVLENVALKVIKQQKKSGGDHDEKLMQARVQSAALYEQSKVIKKAYRGEYYRWLKSTAKEPRQEHIKNYGKIFQLGVGDDDGNDPGDLFGCQCGMELLVDDDLEEFNEKLEGAL